MLRRSFVCLIALAFTCIASAAFAQGSATSSLSGTVVDSGGGVIPGATVVLQSDSAKFEVVTNSSGEYSVPAVPPGKYTVTVTLQGFKTAVVSGVVLNAATPATLKVTLQVGGVEQTVEVKGGAEIIQTQTAAIQKTISVDQINTLPLATRNALNFVTLLPGVDTTGTNRASTVMGLPQSAIGISIDGISVQNNTGKSTDGFYAYVTPRQDAVEQVTVSTATPTADSSGQGAVQIKFVTRSGTNNYSGSLYHYFRHPDLNSNFYFNTVNGLGKNQIILNQFGGREGGPVVIPGLFDGHNKLFFFGNLEIFRQPSDATRTRTILTPGAQAGVFAYNVSGAVQTVDLLKLAAANGQTSTFDPTVSALLAQIAQATTTTGVINSRSDPSTLQYVYQSSAERTETQPTVNLTANLGKHNRLGGAYTFLRLVTYPDILNNLDPRFPGLPNVSGTFADRQSGNLNLRTTISNSMVNEVRYGGSWGPQQFSPQVTADMFTNQGNFNLGFPLGLTSATSADGPNWSGTTNNELDDTLNWQKGKHAIQTGFNFTRLTFTGFSQTVVPGISFGVDTNDPANGMFTAANFPGAANADLSNAKALYSLLTGRVTQISGGAALDEGTGQYVYLGPTLQRDRMDEYGLFVQDAWRVKPSFTLNYGLRWEVQRPLLSLNDIVSVNTIADVCGVSGTGSGLDNAPCNMFKPGTLTGAAPTFKPYDSSHPGYKTDLNNFAPNVGAAWLPHVKSGILRTILGDPDQATIRGGFGIAYNRNGISDYTGIINSNPGISTGATRNVNNGNLLLAGQSFPLLLRDPSGLGAPPFCADAVTAACIPVSPAYPIVSTTATSVNAFDPNLQTAYTKSYSLGLQRALSKDMAVEVRYVGTRLVDGVERINYNETNLLSNGFLNEFQLAQANLQANIAAGKGNTFAFTGAPGTSPLPTYLAYLTGKGQGVAGDPASYTGSNWTNTTFTGRLALFNPNPGSAAGDLNGSAAFRSNALAAGLPANFFQLNPNASSARILTNGGFTRYNALEIELRRRLSRGLQVDANYSFARAYVSSLDTLTKPRVEVQNTGVLPWAIKSNFSYEIPVGRGRRFGANSSGVVNGIVGGWQVIGTARIQSGRVVDFGSVQLVGMTHDELQKAFHVDIRPDDNGKPVVYMLPQDIIDNTIKAFGTSATSATGYGANGAPSGRYLAPAGGPNCIQVFAGDCASRDVYVTGPIFSRVDLSFKKQFSLGGRRTADIEFDLLNAFDAINFTPVANTGTNPTSYQVTAAYQDLSNTFDPGGRLGQIAWRISW